MKLVLLFVCFFSVYTEGQQFGRIVRNVNTNIFSSLVEKNKDSNVVISPLSIGIALSMLYEGTGGRTREQLKTALRFPDPTSIQEDVSGLVDEYENNATNITLRMGNGVFLTGDITPKQQFLDTVVSMYRGEVAELFNSSDKVQEVNSWVRNKTGGLIDQLLSEGSINQDTQMLLLNAVYFYGTWAQPFEKELTTLNKFYLDGDKKRYVVTEFMDLQDTLDIVEEPGRMQVVILNYSQPGYSMILYKPDPNMDIDVLADQVFQPTRPDIRQKANQIKVNLRMPRFDVSTKNSLVDSLVSLNITDIFDQQRANLTGISDKPIEVGDILHAASIKVDEEGSEAAGVTSISIDIRTSVSGPNTMINLDSPFLFSIVDDSGLPLFTGKIVNPTNKLPILETQQPTFQDIPDDAILAVHSSLPEEDPGNLARNQETGDQETENQEKHQPSVQIKCLRGWENLENLENQENRENQENQEKENQENRENRENQENQENEKNAEALIKFTDCEKRCVYDQGYGDCTNQCWKTFCFK